MTSRGLILVTGGSGWIAGYCIAQLLNDGWRVRATLRKLARTDDVRKYIPELPDYGKVITVENLLHHTGGVRDYELILTLDGRDHDALTNADMLSLLARQRSLNFPPGSAFEYSNSGYVLLSLVVGGQCAWYLRPFFGVSTIPIATATPCFWSLCPSRSIA